MFVFVIKNIRLNKNITLYGLSQLTGLSRTYIRNLENNIFFNPSLDNLAKIATALDVNIKDLFYTTLDIEDLRKEMHNRIDTYGLDSKEVLEVSQIIDLLLNVKRREELDD